MLSFLTLRLFRYGGSAGQKWPTEEGVKKKMFYSVNRVVMMGSSVPKTGTS